MELGLYDPHILEAPKMTFPFATHVTVVEVDPDTGSSPFKYAIVYDFGPTSTP